MSLLPPPAPQILRRQIERLLEARGDRDRPTSILAIRAAGPFSGPERMEIGAHRCQLVFCPSALAFREQLTRPRQADEVRVLLTDRLPAELGLDVLARLPGRRLYEIDRWDLLQRAFGAARLDSRLLENEWLAGELLAAAPAQGYRCPASGTLDLETAWRAVFEHRLVLPEGRTEPGDLLRFAESPAAALWAGLPAPLLAAAVARIGQESGPAAAAIAHLLGGGRAADAGPIGLVCRVLFDQCGEGATERRLAVVRLEPLLGEVPPADAALRWAAEAESLLLLQGEAAPATQRILARADQLLEELKAAPWAGLSGYLRSGQLRRRERLAAALEAVLAADSPMASGELAAAALALQEHHRQRRLEAVPAEPLLTVCRWLAGAAAAPPIAGSFLDACRHYAEVLAPIDQARTSLLRFAARLGDARLEQALRLLLGRVAAARESHNARFGELAADFFASGAAGGEEVVAIEDVLSQVLLPLARQGPVLLLVLDGLALATFLDLLQDLRDRGWSELIPAEGRRQLALAALPTISEVCRASLLGGRLERGQQAYEKKAFASESRLRALSAANLPPILFHQAELRAEGGVGLAETVRAEVLRVQRRVVGAVINAVDDHLAKGEQINHAWTVENIKPLAPLLEAAAQAGRSLLITADHGHLLDGDLESREAVGESAARWRSPAGALGAGEMLVRGRRVLAAGGAVVVPWSEGLRYGRRQAGYHGGASPQELLLPLALFATGERAPAGFAEVAFAEALRAAPGGPPDLARAPLPAAAEGLWGRLRESEVYRQSREGLGLAPETEARIGALLDELARQGGQLRLEQLERRLQVGRPRLRALLSQAQRLLHLDGYVVLELDETSGLLRLDRQVLARQFGLGGPDGLP